MKTGMNNFPCICGHDRIEHWGKKNESKKEIFWFCAIAGTGECNGFKLDNLKYLEEQYVTSDLTKDI